MSDKPTIPPSVAEYTLEQLAANTTHDEFTDAQWWYTELDAVAKTADQRRAMAVVRNLMHQYGSACTKATACVELRARLAKYEDAEGSPIAWKASGADWCSSIHRNPDAKAWADFFVAVFPGLADKHELMIGWFANAMMAMHDHLKAQPSGVVLPERYADGQVNIDSTLFNEIRISEPVSEDGEPTKYIITEQQLQRIAGLEFARLNSSPVSAGDTKRAAKSASLAKAASEAIDDMRALAMYDLQKAVYSANSKSNQTLDVDSDLWSAVAGVRVAYEKLARMGLPGMMKNHSPFSAGGVDERAAFEAWYLGHFYMGDKQCGLEWLSTEPCGGYRHQHPAEQWKVWQARAALTASAPNHSEQVREAPSVQITGHLDEVDAPIWEFINAEARNLGPITGSIDSYGLSRPNGGQPNGGVVVLWNGPKIHAVALAVRDAMNRTLCIRLLAAAPSAGSGD